MVAAIHEWGRVEWDLGDARMIAAMEALTLEPSIIRILEAYYGRDVCGAVAGDLPQGLTLSLTLSLTLTLIGGCGCLAGGVL